MTRDEYINRIKSDFAIIDVLSTKNNCKVYQYENTNAYVRIGVICLLRGVLLDASD